MIDWQSITLHLRSSRGSMKNLARLVDSCPQTISRLERGETVEPKFSIGVKLLDLHSDDFPEQHQELRL